MAAADGVELSAASVVEAGGDGGDDNGNNNTGDEIDGEKMDEAAAATDPGRADDGGDGVGDGATDPRPVDPHPSDACPAARSKFPSLLSAVVWTAGSTSSPPQNISPGKSAGASFFLSLCCERVAWFSAKSARGF